jgi:lipoate-protein ligase B
VRTLEQVLIDACAELGVAAGVRDGLTGVWVGKRKIASIGVAIRRWVTWHGFALNVGPDLAGFAAITPCGIAGVEMTSIADQGGPADLAIALPVVRNSFVRRFGYPGWQAFDPDGRALEAAS